MTRPAADPATLPYRPCVGILVLNAAGHVFVGQRRDRKGAWQMPQGGIDAGETIEHAALRELREEIGTANVTILGVSQHWLRYDLPAHLIGVAWKGRWRGQEQKWLAVRFLGDDTEIDLDTEHPEFDAWRWADPAELPTLTVDFKRPVYEAVLAEFAPLLGTSG